MQCPVEGQLVCKLTGIKQLVVVLPVVVGLVLIGERVVGAVARVQQVGSICFREVIPCDIVLHALCIPFQPGFRNAVPGLIGLFRTTKYVYTEQVLFTLVAARHEVRFKV